MSALLRIPRPDVAVDAVIVDHLFQSLVDRLGLGPEPWSWWMFRVFALAVLTSAAASATMAFLGMAGVTLEHGLSSLAVALGAILLIGGMLRDPSRPMFLLVGPFLRLMLLGLAVWGLPVIVLSVVGEADAMRDAAGGTPFLMRVTSFAMAVALPAGASALYLRICRRPPPESRRRGTVRA